MADLTSSERLNLAYKLAFSIQGTSNTEDSYGRKWYEEEFPTIPILVAKDVFTQVVPWANIGEGDAKQAANPSIISKVDIKLTNKSGYNERLWSAHSVYGDESSTILDNFLAPVRFGRGYTVRIFRDDGLGNRGEEITTTEGSWIFAYKTGLLILGSGCTCIDLGWAEPIHLVGYRYIGTTVANTSGGSVDLDAAYGNGSIITANTGPVKIDASSGTNSPLNLTNLTAAPTTLLSTGDIAIIDGQLYSYDGTRTKWLSVNRDKLIFGALRADGNYLQLSGGFSSSESGFICHNNSTITEITAKNFGGNNTKTVKIMKNGIFTSEFTFTLSSGSYSNLSANIDLNQNDILQVFVESDGEAAENIAVQLEIANSK